MNLSLPNEIYQSYNETRSEVSSYTDSIEEVERRDQATGQDDELPILFYDPRTPMFLRGLFMKIFNDDDNDDDDSRLLSERVRGKRKSMKDNLFVQVACFDGNS
ncbi:hypothetical protein M0802_015141 [Mischocyttarus mexicanus]|nr:hypothetical protein M0802_015141 [Mischocyttarus mexicanus]